MVEPRGRALVWTLAVTVLSLGVFAWLAGTGWRAFEPNGCRDEMRPTCFCEGPDDGPVAQPANTFSNLGFVLVGLTIAAAVDRRSLRGGPANPMTTGDFHAGLFAAVTAFLGPGSMFLHASLTREGGLIDVSSMYLFASLLLAYSAMRLFRLGRPGFVLVFVALSAATILGRALFRIPVEPTFGVLVVGFGAVELLVSRRRPDLQIDRRFLWLAAALFGTAFAIWVPSLSGGPLCDPENWIQGHAIWHLLCAGAAGSLFLYLASERPAEPGDGAAR